MWRLSVDVQYRIVPLATTITSVFGLPAMVYATYRWHLGASWFPLIFVASEIGILAAWVIVKRRMLGYWLSAISAGLIPSRRAATVDPARALRTE